jgi:hypothetical protein
MGMASVNNPRHNLLLCSMQSAPDQTDQAWTHSQFAACLAAPPDLEDGTTASKLAAQRNLARMTTMVSSACVKLLQQHLLACATCAQLTHNCYRSGCPQVPLPP